jgi:hypothetical protein
MDLRYTLRMLGVPLDGPAWMFGDNKSVITSATIPHSSLNKRHNALAYHRVREAISAKVMYFIYVPSEKNAADIFTKFLPWAGFWPLVQPLLFWKGETMKGVSPHLPLGELIAYLKESIVGLRGVTRGTVDPVVSPSTDLLGVQDKVGVTDMVSVPVTSARPPVTSTREASYVDLFRNIVDTLRD